MTKHDHYEACRDSKPCEYCFQLGFTTAKEQAAKYVSTKPCRYHAGLPEEIRAMKPEGEK